MGLHVGKEETALMMALLLYYLQRFIYDYRVLKGNYNDASQGALELLSSGNAFELAMVQVEESRPPAELSALQSASPDDIHNTQQ